MLCGLQSSLYICAPKSNGNTMIKKLYLLTLFLGVMVHAAWAGGSKLVSIGTPFDITQMENGESKAVLMYASSGTNYGFVFVGKRSGSVRFVLSGNKDFAAMKTVVLTPYAYTLMRNDDGTFSVQGYDGKYLPGWKSGTTGNFGPGAAGSASYSIKFTATESSISENLLEGGYAFTLNSVVTDDAGEPVSNNGELLVAGNNAVALQFCTYEETSAFQAGHLYSIMPHFTSASRSDYYLTFDGTTLAPNTSGATTSADYWRAVATDNEDFPWKFQNVKDATKYLDNAAGVSAEGSTFKINECGDADIWTRHLWSNISGTGNRNIGSWFAGRATWGFGAQNGAGCFGGGHANGGDWTTDYIIEEIPVASVDGVLYPTLQDAVDAAQNGDLITVLSESGVDEHTAVSVHGKVVRIQYRTEQRAKIYPADMDGIDAEGAAVWTKVKSGAGQHDIYLGTIVCGDFEKVLDYMHYLNDIVRTPFHNCSYFLLQDVTLSGDHYDPAMGLEQGHYYLSTNVGGGTSSTIRAELETDLDLNGCTIEQADTRGGRDGYALLAVQNDANFTLKDSSNPSTGKLVGSLYCATLDDGATFTLQGGSLITKGQVTATYANEPTWGLIVGQRTTATDSHLILDGGNIVGDLRYPEQENGNIYPLYCYANNNIVATENCGSITGAPFVLGELTVNGGTWEDLYAVNDGTIYINNGVFTGDVWDYSHTTAPGHIIIKGGTYTSENPDDIADINELASANEEFELQDNGDGTYGVIPYRTRVAQIGTDKYVTLAEAVAAVPADGTETTIVMIADETIEGNAGVTIPATKNIILDLNGKTVKNAVNENKASQVILNRGTLTIEDNSAEGTGLLTNGVEPGTEPGNWWSTPQYNYATNVISNQGTLTIRSGNIHETATSSICYAIDNNSSAANAILNLEGGHITSLAPTTMRMFCNSTTKENTINMPETSTALIEGGYTALWIQLPGSSAQKKKGALNIAGGTLKGGTYAFYDNTYGDLFDEVQYNLSGGVFDGQYSLFSYGANIDITGGEYTGDVIIKQTLPSEVSVSGGQFAGDVFTYGNNATERFISGGVFTTTEDMYWPSCVVSDYEDIDNTDPSTQGEYPYTVGQNYIITVTYQNGDVVKRGANNVVINDDNTVKKVEVPNAVDYAKIRYTRTIQPYYQSWYVPFDYVITDENAEDMTFLKIWSLQIDPSTGHATDVIGLAMEPGETVKGNTPYVVIAKGAESVVETFAATGLLTSENKSLQCETTELRYKFTGTYDALNLAENPYWALSTEGAFSYWNTLGTVENAFRFIMRIYDKDTEQVVDPHTSTLAHVRMMVFGGDDADMTTGIVFSENEAPQLQKPAFDLTGRRVSCGAKGITIQNGKKYIGK